MSTLGPGASDGAVVFAEIADHAVEGDGGAGGGLGRKRDVPVVRIKSRVADLDGVGARVQYPGQLLAVPLQHHDDCCFDASVPAALAAPRAVERKTFLRM